MRKLNDEERLRAKLILEQKTQKANRVMGFFKIFGLFQIAMIVLLLIIGEADKEEIPFMLIGCVLLFLIYFKFTGFLAGKSQWKVLLNAVLENKEVVHDCELVETYETRHGNSQRAKELMASVSVGGRVINCRASRELEDSLPGTRALLIGVDQNINHALNFVIAA